MEKLQQTKYRLCIELKLSPRTVEEFTFIDIEGISSVMADLYGDKKRIKSLHQSQKDMIQECKNENKHNSS